MVNESDFQVNATENETINNLKKRIEEYEIMLNHYKSQVEPIEIKFCNNSSMRLYEVIKILFQTNDFNNIRLIQSLIAKQSLRKLT